MAMDREAVRLIITVGLADDGQPVTLDLTSSPHLLIAGMTGSGKSVVLHSIITQLIKEHTDDDVAFLFFDPKRVELSRYRGIKHAYTRPVHEVGESVEILAWANGEMDERYALLEKYGYEHLDERNRRNDARIPHCFLIVDELASLMLADPRKVEPLIVRIASMGRAAGMHLILATQRPSADVITGLIKANVPARICLPVVSSLESRIVLDEPGAERLTRPGEMLVRIPGVRGLIHAQGQRPTRARDAA